MGVVGTPTPPPATAVDVAAAAAASAAAPAEAAPGVAAWDGGAGELAAAPSSGAPPPAAGGSRSGRPPSPPSPLPQRGRRHATSLAGQLRSVAAECGVLFGAHGAGLVAALGLRRGASVVELGTVASPVRYFANVAALLGGVDYEYTVPPVPPGLASWSTASKEERFYS
ncbi:hypothetical protein I4F81_011321 [Pyropia yezoensis]|uniref:Uncharacterized protein n=1 Tax=Pyropia yezoensis TaxID=2788 RepID=A0ACC3CFY5_PYRYE|nr:hypothetical protein I4F81_011321 [Neopyropia yezoensis]